MAFAVVLVGVGGHPPEGSCQAIHCGVEAKSGAGPVEVHHGRSPSRTPGVSTARRSLTYRGWPQPAIKTQLNCLRPAQGRDAQVRRVRVHDLRHTCASLLLAQGVDARTIMETLGHSTITMTLDTYAHVMGTALRAASDRMDDVLGPDESEDDPEGESAA
ncbi:tyrosine-type recombinase/integrase [Streptomyces sp. NPDC055105]|uniref:tyrosine-type recombinase/integrase n=1 Tax=Streptomyces sp. NPDC055105 TaxID=3365719 RepID=UPI0037D6121B